MKNVSSSKKPENYIEVRLRIGQCFVLVLEYSRIQ